MANPEGTYPGFGRAIRPAVPSAFPQFKDSHDPGDTGMTLRDYFAAKAMQAMAAAICKMDDIGIITHRPADISQIAYVYADAMLAERSKD